MERIDRRTRLGSKWTGLDFRRDLCWDLGENRWRGTNSYKYQPVPVENCAKTKQTTRGKKCMKKMKKAKNYEETGTYRVH